ncbi:hypothetical protein EVC26_004 [Rhizobium phage RHph_I72]|nr:hypothetical protein EVC13_004 [Rhizobium phage RHph_I65]QIG76450.1 hypothetical protein EVC26_004 [Rhizobium phage RHph_I72]
MSEKLTRIRVPGRTGGEFGFMDWGEKTRAEMVQTIRLRADYMREIVAAIDATADADFEVDVVRGSLIQRHLRKIP